MDCQVNCELAGFFKIVKIKNNGERVIAADWFPNLILNQGLDQMATLSTYNEACQVGSGSTAPSESQTALVSRVAGASRTGTSTSTTSSSAPYYVSSVSIYNFAQGVATGNLSEIGVGTSTAGTTLFSRSLIKDSGGVPTTITVLADESLEVTYELRYYAPATDVTGSIVASGYGSTFSYILRSSNVTTSSTGNGWFLPIAQNTVPGSSVGFQASTTDIGAITSQPTPGGAISAPAALAYTSGNYYIDRICTAAPNQANLSGGIRSFFLKLGIGAYQIQFDPKIPKTSTDVVELTIRLSWSRRP